MAKNLFNQPETCVEDAIQGLLLSNENLSRVGSHNVLVRSDIEDYRQAHVTVISGGGSGHEPAHAGFIGNGMLSAAVLGNVFASPPTSAVLAAIVACAGPKGVLVIVKNYTGDRLNFGMACEKAELMGIRVKMVIVADDCALPVGKGITGGRGIAGTALVHKIAGFLSSQTASMDIEASLDFVYQQTLTCSKAVRSLGVALSTCNVPGSEPSQRLAHPTAIEIGMGIHGESGREQSHLPTSGGAAKFVADVLVDGVMGEDLTAESPQQFFSNGDRLVLLLNNLGTLPLIEMYIMLKEILLNFQQRGMDVVRVYHGHLVTSLDMAGVSLSVMKVSAAVTDGEVDILQCLDGDTTAPAWQRSCTRSAMRLEDRVLHVDLSSSHSEEDGGRCTRSSLSCHGALARVSSVCEAIIRSEAVLAAQDAVCGDGDCGAVMAAGARHVRHTVCSDLRLEEDSAALCSAIAEAVSTSMGGTSGALLQIMFTAMSAHLTQKQVW